jgi:ADP-dependent NAD(P)H-hydrate dehydratase
VSDQAVEVVADNASRCDALLIGPGMMDDRAGLAKTLLAWASSRAGARRRRPGRARPCSASRRPGSDAQRGEMAKLLDWDKAASTPIRWPPAARRPIGSRLSS